MSNLKYWLWLSALRGVGTGKKLGLLDQLLTPEGDWRVDVFSAYIADVGQEAWQLELAPEGYREGWIQDVMDRSLVQAPAAPRQGERILTLSTCSYEFANARFVVHGIIRPWDMANSAGQ